ncbi:prepilin-type N-terminal cleavage/methylation domain-containing protein [Xylophilus rhododendri]|uniref:Type II secretion system protein H n=1 Tax=Xylophilus rhododendri TaxID=2697032 RepID=A0A857JFN0_9BURK|nr:GspH/FimT family pseudopilin [Xylophilus rhododendri]QHJ01476.1 prepilin-type N-terminal cleavage/methylation domain-containing protein [Xylophilus rhododendri]
MGPDRLHGRPGAAGPPGGFSLIELLVGISMLAVLLGLALPSFSDWMRNNQVRSTAETLREGLQLARSEALKRNTRVRMQLVSTLDNSCALSASGPYWVVNIGSAVSPAGACGALAGSGTGPNIIQKGPMTAASSKVSIAALPATAVVAFDASGRLSPTLNPTVAAPVPKTQIDIQFPGSACVVSSGTVRCLRLVVYPAGEVRMCDPAQTSATDPTRC